MLDLDEPAGKNPKTILCPFWTAEHKGNTALEGALANLVKSAVWLGANAIIGVQAATFGAGGGITSVVGGDAVGVLITGTAVFVEKEPSPV